MRTILCLPLIPALIACASPYVAPVSGDVAEIRLRYIGDEAFALVHAFKEPQCVGALAIGVIGSRRMLTTPEKDPTRGIRPTMLGSSGRPDAEVLEIAIPASKPLTLLYTQLGPHDLVYARTCKLPVTFTPAAGAQYEIQYRSGREVCSAELFRLEQGGGGGFRLLPVYLVKGSQDCKAPGF
jgi:hypothetical protein